MDNLIGPSAILRDRQSKLKYIMISRILSLFQYIGDYKFVFH